MPHAPLSPWGRGVGGEGEEATPCNKTSFGLNGLAIFGGR
jgi:hypothetical protein